MDNLYIAEAIRLIERANGDVQSQQHLDCLIQDSIANSLIAIAQELNKITERAELEEHRRELLS